MVQGRDGTGETRASGQTPSPPLALDILTKIQKYSAPFGTKIDIENGVGIIRVPPEATVPVGADIRATFKADSGRPRR
jgi:hypothetical protein